ncbi:3-keto-5-aminohexanoate cleavage protein [Chloroflexota bacterium]
MMSYTWNHADPYEYVRRIEREEMPPLIITVAITGGGAGKERNTNLPETFEEQAKSAHEAYNAGASSVHIHARDETGAETSTDPLRYREINRRVRELCPDIIIGNTTGVSPWDSRDKAVKILDAEPEICSLNMGPFHIYMLQKRREPPLQGRTEDIQRDDILLGTWQDIRRIAQIAQQRGIKPEMELYNASMFWNVQKLIKEGLLNKPYWMQLIFSTGFEPPTPKALVHMIDFIPADSLWSVIGVGAHQLPMTTMSIIMGGHVRVGFEDNLFYRRSELAVSNAQLVERTVRIARELGREIATPSQARNMLGIPEIPKKY